MNKNRPIYNLKEGFPWLNRHSSCILPMSTSWTPMLARESSINIIYDKQQTGRKACNHMKIHNNYALVSNKHFIFCMIHAHNFKITMKQCLKITN